MYSATGEAAKPSSLTLRFSLAEIQAATENFRDEQLLGEGGFGKVYKGHICIAETSYVVAIKRLSCVSEQGELEFRTEIEVISKLRHRNLVSLIGFCDDNKEMILVYEYMPNGTLYHHLHKDSTPLNWVQRLKIAVGAACGLEHLHKGDDMNQGIIHRDVKSSNILLDENWEAVISDFGLSKIVPIDRSVYTSAKGSFGYMDLEYFYTGKLTRGTDVYAFGVVLFELLSGRLAVDLSKVEESSLVRWATKCVKERKFDQLVDANIKGTIYLKCLGKFVKIADRCLLSDPKERPTMTEVVASLKDLQQIQKKWDNSAKSSITTVFSWTLPKFRTSTKENQDQRRASSPTNPENNLDQASLTNKEVVSRDLKVFTVDEMRRATRGFAEDAFLGAWSYGDVYKGWVDKTPVVIKSLCWNRSIKLENAKLELEILKEFSHPNLVKLIGYCLSYKQLFLVNEVMPNGNFEDHLFSGAIERLPLVTKVKIAVGVARGIVFLHNARDYITTYLHWRGTNSMFWLDRSKILLDEDFTPKLSDCEVTKLAHGHYPYNIRDDNGLVYGDYYPRFSKLHPLKETSHHIPFVTFPSVYAITYICIIYDHSAEPFQLQSNLDGFTLILMEVLTGKQVSYDHEVQKMDDLLLQHGKMSIRRIAKLCFEICNEADSELKMLTLLEEYEMYIRDPFATATAESCLLRGRSCRI